MTGTLVDFPSRRFSYYNKFIHHRHKEWNPWSRDTLLPACFSCFHKQSESSSGSGGQGGRKPAMLVTSAFILIQWRTALTELLLVFMSNCRSNLAVNTCRRIFWPMGAYCTWRQIKPAWCMATTLNTAKGKEARETVKLSHCFTLERVLMQRKMEKCCSINKQEWLLDFGLFSVYFKL